MASRVFDPAGLNRDAVVELPVTITSRSVAGLLLKSPPPYASSPETWLSLISTPSSLNVRPMSL